MPRPSTKSLFLETLGYFALESLVDKDTNHLISDEEVFTLWCLVEGNRYLVPRIPKSIPRKSQWWELALTSEDYDEEIFRTHFRMDKESFLELRTLLEGQSSYKLMQDPIELQLAVSLYRFGTYGNSSSLNHVATKFQISKGSVVNFTNRTINALLAVSKQYIRWPDSAERKEISRQMASEVLPKCIGFVDGTDAIFEEAPLENNEVYWSRKKKYCMQVQIICDPNKLIRDLYTGYPGSVHDAKVFSTSPIGMYPSKYFSDGEFIIGDSAYTLTESVITPFKRTSIGLTSTQKSFNYHLSSKRVAVEHTIGILKERFQSLRGLRTSVSKLKGHRRICEWIHACAVLHNFLLRKDPWADQENICECTNEAEPEQLEVTNLNKRGALKRQALLEIFQNMRT